MKKIKTSQRILITTVPEPRPDLVAGLDFTQEQDMSHSEKEIALLARAATEHIVLQGDQAQQRQNDSALKFGEAILGSSTSDFSEIDLPDVSEQTRETTHQIRIPQLPPVHAGRHLENV